MPSNFYRTHLRNVVLSVLVGALATLSIVSPASAEGPPATKIVGGSVADITQYPFYATLDVDGGLCGGTLVAPKLVLTAAHCVAGLGDDKVTAYFGRQKLSDTGGHVRQSTDIVVHPDWDSVSKRNDAALVTLSASVPVAPVGLANDPARWEAGDVARIIGHGTTSPGGDVSDDLLQADVPIASDEDCGDADSYGDSYDASLMLCAGYEAGGVDTCQGDSGGPLLVQSPAGILTTAGIVSFGDGCAAPEKFGVYSRIGEGPLRTFVNDQIAASLGPAHTGLNNPSFESAFDPVADWEAIRIPESGLPEPGACTDDQRGICRVGVDTFTDSDSGATYTVSPVDGASMVRLAGPFTTAGQNQQMDRYVLKQRFRVDPADPVIDLNYNAFLYDYTGFDELRIRVSVKTEDGDVIYNKVQGAFSSGTALKNTGWIGNKVNLGGYEGQDVVLKIDSGGTLDRLFGWWIYLDAGDLPESAVGDPVAPAQIQAPNGTIVPVSSQTNESGQTFFTVPSSAVGLFPDSCMPLALQVPIAAGAGTISNPVLRLVGSDAQQVNLEDPDGDGTFTIAAGQTLCARTGSLIVEYDLTEGGVTQHFSVPIGGVSLIDPQGVVYDKEKYGSKLAELGAQADCVEGDATPEQVECGAEKSAARTFAAIDGANVRLQRLDPATDEFHNVLSGDPGITPNVNPQVTSANGIYQWDVSPGEYRVVVNRSGYVSTTSRSVAIPPPVEDLHVAMERAKPTAALSAPATVAEGEEAVLASVSIPPEGGSIASMQYDTDNDGAFDDAVGASAKVIFSSPGAKTVRLQVTDDDGDTSTVAKTITVANVNPVAAMELSARGVVGETLTAKSTSRVKGSFDQLQELVWDTDNDGAFDDGSGEQVGITLAAAGTRTIKLRAKDEDGDTATVAQAITVETAQPPTPPPSATPLPPPPPGGSGTLNEPKPKPKVCKAKKGKAKAKCKTAQKRKAALAKCKKIKKHGQRAKCRAAAKRIGKHTGRR